MIDLEENHDIADAFPYQPGRKLLIASTGGYGFIVPEDEVVASTRKGKQVLNVSEPEEAKLCVPVDGDHVAVLGENRKMLVFKLDEINEMTRGKGVILQRFKDGAPCRCARVQEGRRLDVDRLAPGAPSRCHGRSCATGSACGRKPGASCRKASRGPTPSGRRFEGRARRGALLVCVCPNLRLRGVTPRLFCWGGGTTVDCSARASPPLVSRR